jgi:hypothetical protein
MIGVFVEGIGVRGPGFSNWFEAQKILTGTAPLEPGPVDLPAIEQLPTAERRRTGAAVRLAVAVGLEALAHAERDAHAMATVFTSSGSDGQTIHAILETLATEQREISPTRFHNSVHNAPSGYWALACAAKAPSTSLCGYDGSFAIGLLDAAAQAHADGIAVTLIAYDLPYPEPLRTARDIATSFATALVLTPQRTARSIAECRIVLDQIAANATAMRNAALEALRRSNPAARSLPLLAALADMGGTVRIAGIEDATLEIAVIPL